jgi:four helix bundle protein
MEHYRALKVWQRAMEMVCSAYAVSALLPAQERFGLASQMQRAAVSVAASIAEGHERRFPREYLRFLAIASGSLAELETLLDVSTRVGLVVVQDVDECRSLADEVGRMIRAIETTMRNRVGEEPGLPGAALV